MRPAIHFIGFKCDQRFWNAVRVFGLPDFIHPGWDKRANREIWDEDIVIFANGPADQTPRAMNYTDPNQD